MIEEAKAEGCVREIVALHVVLLDRVIDVVRQSQVLGCGTAALVFVRGYVCAEAQGTEAVACDGLLGATSFGHLDADVVALGALFAQEANAAPVELLGAAGCGRSAAITPNGSTYFKGIQFQ